MVCPKDVDEALIQLLVTYMTVNGKKGAACRGEADGA